MAATFPGGVKVFTTKQAGDQIASAHINDLQDEVVAVETELRKTSGSVVSHGSLAGLGDNDHPQYLLKTAKAADSDKLDGLDSTSFALVSNLGAWQSWTPTVSFNNTAPTVSITYARYARMGKVVHVQGLIAVTKGSSDSTQFSISMPVQIVRTGLSILYWETIWQTDKIIRVGYGYASTSSFLCSKDTAIARDGEIGFNYTYEAA